MDENLLDINTDVSGGDAVLTESVQSVTQSGNNNLESNISNTGGVSNTSSSTSVVVDTMYDEELGGYPVVIVNDVSDYEVSLFSLPDGATGYQVNDYWLEYFRGVLQKHIGEDYLAFATREYLDTGSSYNNYLVHNWLYVGDLENGGDVLVYDCYTYSSVYYVDISTENMGAINVDDYDTLVYSNLGNASDIRKGDSYNVTLAVLFFLGFFAVYAVCRGFFEHIVQRIYRK